MPERRTRRIYPARSIWQGSPSSQPDSLNLSFPIISRKSSLLVVEFRLYHLQKYIQIHVLLSLEGLRQLLLEPLVCFDLLSESVPFFDDLLDPFPASLQLLGQL